MKIYFKHTKFKKTTTNYFVKKTYFLCLKAFYLKKQKQYKIKKPSTFIIEGLFIFLF